MSSESKKIKPKADFQLVLNYSNQCIWKNDSGAGANAASRVDMAFSATDPLSEIVWSPNKGFSLNCVDSSFDDKNSTLYQDVEPSSMVLALLQSHADGMSAADKPIDDVIVKPIAVICANNDISFTRLPTSDSDAIFPDGKADEKHDTGSGVNMEKTNSARGAPNLPNDQANIGTAISGQVDRRPVDNFLHQVDDPQLSMEQNPSPRKHSIGEMDIGNQVILTEDGLHTKVDHINEYEGSGVLTSSSRSLLEKLESTAENDLHTFNCEATCTATGRVFVSKTNEDKNKSQGNEMMLPCEKSLPVLGSPINSRIHMTRNKGKENSLLDEDANVSLSKEENDHLSVKSCYSTGLFSIGKKRCSFEQQLIIESRRVKKKIQETSYSKSYIQQDSSFMNLISNMLKGFSQSTQDEGKSLAVTIENHDHHLLWPDQKIISCNKNQDPEPQHIGFKSNFQSTYCPSLENFRTRNQVGEASKDFEQGNKVHGIDVTPISCYAENNSLYKQHLQSNKFEVFLGRYDSGTSLQPKIGPIEFLNSHENRKNNSVEYKNCYHLGLSKEMEGMSYSSSTRQNKSHNENVESYALFERKETDNIFQKTESQGALWITRFLRKSTAPLIICDQLNEIGGSQDHFTDYSMSPHSHKRITYLNNCKIEETKEEPADDLLLSETKKLKNCCISTPKHKFNPITPFPGFRDSEAMASMFARRLDAIRHADKLNG